MSYAYMAHVKPTDVPYAVSGTPGAFTASGIYGGMYHSPLDVQNATVDYKVHLAAGTYRVRLWFRKANDTGILTVSLNGTPLSPTVDGYAAGASSDNLQEWTGVTVADGGVQTVRLTCATKNASSSGYVFRFQHLNFLRTGA